MEVLKDHDQKLREQTEHSQNAAETLVAQADQIEQIGEQLLDIEEAIVELTEQTASVLEIVEDQKTQIVLWENRLEHLTRNPWFLATFATAVLALLLAIVQLFT